MVADTLSILSYTSIDKYEHSTKKDWCRANKLFAVSMEETNEDFSTKSLKCAKRKKRAEKR